MPDQTEAGSEAPIEPDQLRAWIAVCLVDEFRLPSCDFPRDSAVAAGILPWLAYRLHESGALTERGQSKRLTLTPALREELRHALRRCSLMHLDCETELERLILSAAKSGIRFLAFKGHAVARTLYPHPACRTTSDFDLLIDPGQLEQVKSWLTAAGYAPTDPFAGTIWLGAQNWVLAVDGKARFHVDVHWDYSNRMFFRKRLAFSEIWGASQEVACGEATLRVPGKVDNLLFACVHLAAFDPGVHVRLIWLLDIYLLMAALDEADVAFLRKRAAGAAAVEACLAFGEMAAELGDAVAVEPVLEALRGVASERRARFYARTLRSRGFDLVVYWGRLSVREKIIFFGDLIRWVKVRDRG
jgi:hypothetical protein